MAAFDLALSRVRDGSADHHLVPAQIDQLARADGHVFRHTTPTPGNTLRLFVRQVAHGNVACAAVRHLSDGRGHDDDGGDGGGGGGGDGGGGGGGGFSDSAWCQARARLPMDLIRRVHQGVIDGARRELDQADDVGDGGGSYRWRGHRLHVVDGTSAIRCPTRRSCAPTTACRRDARRRWASPPRTCC